MNSDLKIKNIEKCQEMMKKVEDIIKDNFPN